MNRRIHAFLCAFNGWLLFFKEGVHPKIHLFAAIVVVILGFTFQLSVEEWLFISIAITMVMVTEMLNSAVEKLCDVLHPEKHPTIKFVKDVAAGAVLLAAFAAMAIGLLIFLPKLF
ncbi:MAG: diacylglycerol kinase family protein [Schleiferiaceae bacterium]|nr:diacylglycerol kinase family protein [Schleiferiaceae bacterium]